MLDEIDNRLIVVEALQRFCDDSSIDELKTLHPLVTRARWLFGPEYDSPLYTSNTTLVKAVEKIFGQKIDKSAFYNYKNRPDLVVLEDSTLSTVGTDDFNEEGTLVQLKRILIIELKRGASTIGRDELTQAENYVEDLLNCGFIEGKPYINAFVVGNKCDDKISKVRKVGEKPELGRIQACTYGQLVRTASARLFNLRKELVDRYQFFSDDIVAQKALGVSKQLQLTVKH